MNQTVPAFCFLGRNTHFHQGGHEGLHSPTLARIEKNRGNPHRPGLWRRLGKKYWAGGPEETRPCKGYQGGRLGESGAGFAQNSGQGKSHIEEMR